MFYRYLNNNKKTLVDFVSERYTYIITKKKRIYNNECSVQYKPNYVYLNAQNTYTSQKRISFKT